MFKNKFSKKNNRSYEEIHFSCTIRFLDDAEPINVSFQKETRGQWLIEHVCNYLNLAEKDYFGLRYVDQDKQRHWLDPLKPVYKQLKEVSPMVLCFRVKFYPSDPMKLHEEITRYFLFLQLRRDLHHGRLLCSQADANLLAAYIIQSEVGDYDPVDHPPNYVAEFKMLPKQTQKQEEKIAELHKTLVGQVPSEAEANFLKKASCLDTYGVDPHPVKDQKSNQMYLGVTHLGIITFQGNKRIHLFKWPQINRIAFEGKMFIVHITVTERGSGVLGCSTAKRKKHACGFKCPTYSACKHLWKCAVEQQYFFTLQSSVDAPRVSSGGSLFTRGSKFRFSGRCQKEVYHESSLINRDAPDFTRSPSNPEFVRTISQRLTQSLPTRLIHRAEKPINEEPVIFERSAEDQTEVVADITMLELGENEKLVDDQQTTPMKLSIPDEDPVVMADTSYHPDKSPDRDDASPLSFSFEEDTTLPSPSLEDTQKDLDAQIQELQTELEKCRSKETNHLVNATPNGKGRVSLAPEDGGSVPNSIENHIEHTTDVSEGVKCESPPGKTPVSVMKTVLLSIMTAIVLLMILSLFVLECDMDIPVLRDVRNLKEVKDFKHYQYDPLKSSVTQTVGGWFKA